MTGALAPHFLISPKARGVVILSERAQRASEGPAVTHSAREIVSSRSARAKDLLSRKVPGRLCRRAERTRAKDLPSRRTSGAGRKQVLRAFGAQDDSAARFGREEGVMVGSPS